MSSAANQPTSQRGELVRKMAAVMKAVKRIPKRGVVSGDGASYETTTAGDVFEAVREELANQGVLLICHPAATEISDTDVVCNYVFQWTDGVETIEVTDVTVRVLEQRSKSDKAIQSAYTTAHKMVVMNQFLMSTEQSDSQARPNANQKRDTQPASSAKVTGQLQDIKQGDYKANEEPFMWAKVDGQLYIVPPKPAQYLADMLDAMNTKLPVAITADTIKKANSKYPRIIHWHTIDRIGEQKQEAARG